ncbi:MAG: ion transporter [Saprospiraceae bacterium]|nr:ion transporter [Saprospiraceae bacterium]
MLQSIRGRFKNVQGLSNWFSLVVDLLMIGLIIFDLLWLMFDSIFTVKSFQEPILKVLPWYRDIHDDFLKYDGIIVSIFIAELLIRWVISVSKKEYAKWFFFPFAHWYDVLGCIPTSSFRILRLLRFYGLLYRLHKWDVINLNDYYLYRLFLKYYNIIVEEVADRVVIRVLSETKSELEEGVPITNALVKDVFSPKKEKIIHWMSAEVQKGILEKYHLYREDLESYIRETVCGSVVGNREVKRLKQIPLLGGQIETTLNKAVSGIVFGVVDQIFQDLGQANGEDSRLIEIIVEGVFDLLVREENFTKEALPTELITESIDLIIRRVNVKKWKEGE